jgi:predicted ATPase/class 3 adenylate cyclase
MADLPTGSVTFLFTDIEGSTRLLTRLGSDYGPLLDAHHAIMRGAIRESGGMEVATQGDSFFAVFSDPLPAIEAAVVAQRNLASALWPQEAAVRVRMGVHTGEALLGGDNYVGLSVHRASRIADAAHGGQILISEPTLAEVRERLPVGVSVRPLGQHWLRDLESPESLTQLVVAGLPSDFPPLRVSRRRMLHLPAELTPFIGRETELHRVTASLSEARLVTLVGPGGTGKTRLAVRVASSVAGSFPDGVAFVALDDVSSADFVASAIAPALGIAGDPTEPLIDVLEKRLATETLLLVLDNLEQVAGASRVIARLLAATASLRILATSRSPLHVLGERSLQIPPLQVPEQQQLPSVEALRGMESIALFVARAREADSSFELTEENAGAVASICRNLDGLPLAIELAAARTRLLSPQMILDRLERPLALLASRTEGVPERQASLRAAINWSHELLDEAERRVFRRLSVFAGGWTIEGAETVVSDGEVEVLDLLESLVDKSLVRRVDRDGIPHFEMLATIREFAAQQLAVDPNEERLARQSHLGFWTALVEREAPRLEQGSDAMLHITHEQENIRAALRFGLRGASDAGDPAVEPSDAELGLRLAIGMGPFWMLSGAREGSAWLERAISVAEALSPRIQAKAFYWSGVLLEEQHRPGEAETCLDQSLVRFRQLADGPWQARVLNSLGVVVRSRGELARARELLLESLEIRREVGPAERLAAVLSNLGVVATDAGDLPAAREHLEASLAIDRANGNLDGIATGLGNLASVALRDSHVEEAERLIGESLQLFSRVGDVLGIADDLEHAAEAASQRGDHQRAATLIGAVESLRNAEGLQMPAVEADRYRSIVERVRNGLGSEAFARAYETGCGLDREAAIALALAGLPPA